MKESWRYWVSMETTFFLLPRKPEIRKLSQSGRWKLYVVCLGFIQFEVTVFY